MLRYIKIEHRQNGIVLVLNGEGKKEIHEIREQHPEWTEFAVVRELLDYQLCNGWELKSAQELGALTSCELILIDHSNGNIYWHGNYQVENELTALLNGSYREKGLFLNLAVVD